MRISDWSSDVCSSDDGQDRLCGLSAPLCRGGTLMRTILVTGGAGFIGSAVCRHLIGRGDTRVINFDKLTYAGNPASLTTIAGSPLYHFVEGDIGDTRLVADLLGAMRPDAIMHLAAESHVDRSIDRKSTRLNSSH